MEYTALLNPDVGQRLHALVAQMFTFFQNRLTRGFVEMRYQPAMTSSWTNRNHISIALVQRWQFAAMIRIVLSTVVAYSLVNVALADDHLQVREGLEFWYDADQIARTVSESEVSRDGGMVRIAAWPDASGKNRHALQSNLDAQPHLIQIGESQVVRFDGVDDYLRITGIDCAAEAATVFVVAAPHKNAGSYRAFLAANSPQQSDFVSGFTLDQGSGATQAFNTLNVEGPGFGGAQNLLRSVTPFSTLHVIETAISPSQQLVKLSVDGIEAGTRPFEPNTLSLAELTIGARYYGFGNLAVQGCTAGDIAEILIYSRELTTAELSHVREYLLTKHAKLKDMPRQQNLWV